MPSRSWRQTTRAMWLGRPYVLMVAIGCSRLAFGLVHHSVSTKLLTCMLLSLRAFVVQLSVGFGRGPHIPGYWGS